MYFPGLPEDAKIRKVIFMRRKPLGFSTGHALLVSGNYSRTTRARLFASWGGVFTALCGLIVFQQVKLNAWKLPFGLKK